ncbi:MAG: bifunctional 23S rRNA (guanine(2069)-N(7))-methyltransferase RlmK/23S rRNA (guanine(2445)-N(2))-methyltransferase RlmL [Wenzhouxiangellaceae bacterium]|nr:bifunctional 23S rRNA (guanine(2069)-N(7))-methyltransferase RlmK/23S rRNA (guanine(2445)-N(2))-methyltransferase RlmL [Wenzhouxiangellaceae bacterium]
MTRAQPFFATAPRGLEALLAEELVSLGMTGVHPARSGVDFTGTLTDAYRACLWSRVANRVLLPIAEFDAADDTVLYEAVHALDWPGHLAPDRTLAVDFTGIRPAIAHSRFATQRVKDGIVDRMRAATGARPSVDTGRPDVRVNVHMERTRTTVSIDLAGDSLHRRGYREPGTTAPLKENLAAAMLLRAGWPEIAQDGGSFCDPMTGSGTLPIEAAWMAGDSAPGLMRTYFGFLGWAGHDDAAWKALIDEALERREAGLARLPPIHAFDRDGPALKVARAGIEHAGLAGFVHVERRELRDARPPAGAALGLVAVNPPYGERLAESHELLPLYLQLGETLRRHFPGWRAVVLNGAGCEIGLAPDRTWRMDNGPIRCRLERFEITAQPHEPRVPPAEDLANRVHKNLRRLKKWRVREDVTCYRVYDADIPEYALAVDVYETDDGPWLHVQEYAPPASVDARSARARLRAALGALPPAMDVPAERMVFKVRRRQRGRAQYEKHGTTGRFLTVREGPCRLLVNLTDYLDTGLFLDHRPIRRWLGEHAGGKRFLNLFCYTGAATVHAAKGGARETVSVDLSNTYLDWLKRNLTLNGLDRERHRTVRADAREWLGRCRETFDLVFLDPPSFSASKKMDASLDIQRDHAALIRAAMRCVAPGGVLVFSANLRRFRLDEELAGEFDFDDRSARSIPKDFERNARIHRCWFVRHRSPAAE